MLSFTLLSALFAAFAVGCAANSINIIDGFNGLASIMSTLVFVGYAMIAWQVGDTILAACLWFWLPVCGDFSGSTGRLANCFWATAFLT